MLLFDFISPFSRRPRVSTIPSADTTFGFAGPEGRRSTRIERPVPLLITGHDDIGQQFLERTSAVSLADGCGAAGGRIAAVKGANRCGDGSGQGADGRGHAATTEWRE